MFCLSSLEPPLVCACGWELVADVGGGGRSGCDGGSGHSCIPAR